MDPQALITSTSLLPLTTAQGLPLLGLARGACRANCWPYRTRPCPQPNPELGGASELLERVTYFLKLLLCPLPSEHRIFTPLPPSGLAFSLISPRASSTYILLLWVASQRTCPSRVPCHHGFPKVRRRICNRQGPRLPVLFRGRRRRRPVHMDPTQWHETCMHKVDNLRTRRANT